MWTALLDSHCFVYIFVAYNSCDPPRKKPSHLQFFFIYQQFWPSNYGDKGVQSFRILPVRKGKKMRSMPVKFTSNHQYSVLLYAFIYLFFWHFSNHCLQVVVLKTTLCLFILNAMVNDSRQKRPMHKQLQNIMDESFYFSLISRRKCWTRKEGRQKGDIILEQSVWGNGINYKLINCSLL